MKTVIVKELMVPLEEYATVSKNASLADAVLALEKAQMTLDPRQHKHRAVLVLDENGKVVGKLTMKDIIVALEPNYGKLESEGVLERSGFSPDLIESMLEVNTLWAEPLQFFIERAGSIVINEFIQDPAEDEYIDENATMDVAVHNFIMYPHHSLLVTSGDDVVGILRLSDVFTKISDVITSNYI